MKKMTEEQAEKWDRVEKRIANWFWGLVAAVLIIYSALQGPTVP